MLTCLNICKMIGPDLVGCVLPTAVSQPYLGLGGDKKNCLFFLCKAHTDRKLITSVPFVRLYNN